jgi:hypothetical protein
MNEKHSMIALCDAVSLMVAAAMLARDNRARNALFNTVARLFEGLSDIAKAVMIILVADTMLGYHSEEGWTGLIDVVLGRYGVEGGCWVGGCGWGGGGGLGAGAGSVVVRAAA